MRVAFLTKDFSPDPTTGTPIPNGCAYYRCALPMYSLKNHEAKMGLPAWLPERGFGVVTGKHEAEFGFPVVVLKLLMGNEIPHQIKVAQSIGQKIIIDVDDHYDDIHDDNIAAFTTDPSRRKTWNRKNYRKSILAADMITVTTPFLYNYYSDLHSNVRMIRNGINPSMFKPRQQRRIPTIGWAGAIPWRSNDLQELWWLPQFLEDHDLAFHHFGVVEESDTVATRLGIDPRRFTSSPMLPLSLYPEGLLNFDIGVVPLSNIPFNEAKSCLKGLEYACANIPFVASALPEYQLLAGQGIGRVAKTGEDWIRHMTELLDYRTRLHESVRQKRSTDKHTIFQRSGEWNAAIESLV